MVVLECFNEVLFLQFSIYLYLLKSFHLPLTCHDSFFFYFLKEQFHAWCTHIFLLLFFYNISWGFWGQITLFPDLFLCFGIFGVITLFWPSIFGGSVFPPTPFHNFLLFSFSYSHQVLFLVFFLTFSSLRTPFWIFCVFWVIFSSGVLFVRISKSFTHFSVTIIPLISTPSYPIFSLSNLILFTSLISSSSSSLLTLLFGPSGSSSPYKWLFPSFCHPVCLSVCHC